MTLLHLHTPTTTGTAGSVPAADTRTLGEALFLRRVTASAWQVCDDRVPVHAPGHLLGFIEDTADGVELMQLGDKFIWTGFPTTTAALAHVEATAYVTATQRAAGDLAWLT